MNLDLNIVQDDDMFLPVQNATVDSIVNYELNKMILEIGSSTISTGPQDVKDKIDKIKMLREMLGLLSDMDTFVKLRNPTSKDSDIELKNKKLINDAKSKLVVMKRDNGS